MFLPWYPNLLGQLFFIAFHLCASCTLYFVLLPFRGDLCFIEVYGVLRSWPPFYASHILPSSFPPPLFRRAMLHHVVFAPEDDSRNASFFSASLFHCLVFLPRASCPYGVLSIRSCVIGWHLFPRLPYLGNVSCDCWSRAVHIFRPWHKDIFYWIYGASIIRNWNFPHFKFQTIRLLHSKWSAHSTQEAAWTQHHVSEWFWQILILYVYWTKILPMPASRLSSL